MQGLGRALVGGLAKLGCARPPSASKEDLERRNSDLEHLRQAFAQFDQDGSGTIDKAELGAVIKALGHHATPVELDALMERLDADNSGTIDFEEFVAVMAHRQEEEELEREIEELAAVFMSLDTDGSGNLSVDELRRALGILGTRMSREEVEVMMAEIDSNNDGEVSCEEFMQYLMQFKVEEGDGDAGDHH